MESEPAIPPPLTPTPFYEALVASGIVEPLALHRAMAEVAAEGPTTPGAQDQRLAERLREARLLNAWQLEQLHQGRTKFNLGPYKIVDSIARGGMGHVFKAEHRLLGRVEAIKVLPRHKTTPETVATFHNEVRAQATLDHPNLVRVSYADQDGETHYLVTEYVPGVDLRRLVRRHGPLDEGAAASVCGQVAAALDHAHRRGLVHRDVKPGNVLVTPRGDAKLTDLGLVWSLRHADDAPGQGKVVGTPDYVAPEAIREPARVRPESDLYALGCTLYYAVTGKVPFPGGAHADKMRRRLSGSPIDPRLLAPNLSAETADLIRRLTARRPRDRPRDAAEVVAELSSRVDPDAAARVGAGVVVAMRRQAERLQESNEWSTDAVDELPETVGPDDAVAEAAPADVASEEVDEPVPRPARMDAPTAIALLAAVVAAAIAAAALLV